MSDRIAAIGEWVAASVDAGRVRLSMGDEQTETGKEEYFATLTPDGALSVALELIEKAYTAKGEDVKRILILLNPEMDEPEVETPAEGLPS